MLSIVSNTLTTHHILINLLNNRSDFLYGEVQ